MCWYFFILIWLLYLCKMYWIYFSWSIFYPSLVILRVCLLSVLNIFIVFTNGFLSNTWELLHTRQVTHTKGWLFFSSMDLSLSLRQYEWVLVSTYLDKYRPKDVWLIMGLSRFLKGFAMESNRHRQRPRSWETTVRTCLCTIHHSYL